MLATIVVVSLIGTGCHTWQPSLARHRLPEDCRLQQPADFSPQALVEKSRNAQNRGAALEQAGNESCVDWYFAATRSAWVAAQAYVGSEVLKSQAQERYHAGLIALLRTAQRFGRFDPRVGLYVRQDSRAMTIPVIQHGFAWLPSDFQQFTPPPPNLPSLLRQRYCKQGCGVPIVVTRCRDPNSPTDVRFFPPQTPFAATVVLRFSSAELGNGAYDALPVLEFYNPLQAAGITADGETVPLAADLTAPLAVALEDSPRTYFAGFIQPGRQGDEARLTFLEPYQPGKIPVVLIHGLFSDPQSWADLINDLRASPGFAQRFQIWAFRYPTGQGFLQSAARLRGELQAAFQDCDPADTDLAIRRTVLVGHSMGGLIAKLQVTESEDKIWREFSSRPFSEIHAGETTRKRLAEACFFQPLPQITRVIFIATPHCGANSASGAIGRLASRLVEIPAEDAMQHEQLIAQNPGVFADFVQTRLPTSVDLLEPSSPVLTAMRDLRFGCRVKLHSIIGVHDPIGPSDGVVPVSSARHPHCLSEKAFASPHGKVHRATQASSEVLRILNQHLADSY
jgi:Alpha/beta hydrolase family